MTRIAHYQRSHAFIDIEFRDMIIPTATAHFLVFKSYSRLSTTKYSVSFWIRRAKAISCVDTRAFVQTQHTLFEGFEKQTRAELSREWSSGSKSRHGMFLCYLEIKKNLRNFDFGYKTIDRRRKKKPGKYFNLNIKSFTSSSQFELFSFCMCLLYCCCAT